MSRAVLVVDVQRALTEGEYRMHDCDGVIDRINRVTAKARSAGAPVVIVQHQAPTGPLVQGSPDWQLAPALQVAPTDTILGKTAPNAFHQTDLDVLLRATGVTELIICGMQSDVCVDSTTRRALALGYAVVLVSDGHTTLANNHLSAPQIIAHQNQTLAELTDFEARVRVIPAVEVEFGG